MSASAKQTAIADLAPASKARQVVARCEKNPQSFAGLAYGENSRELSNAVREALKAKGFRVKSVRAIYSRGYRGIRATIPHDAYPELSWEQYKEQVRDPAYEVMRQCLGGKVSFEVGW